MNINLSQALKINFSYLLRVVLFSIPAILIFSTIKFGDSATENLSFMFIELVGLIALLPIRLLAFRKTIYSAEYSKLFKNLIPSNASQYKFFFAWLILTEIPVFILNDLCSTLYPHLMRTDFYMLVHLGYSIITSAIVLKYLINNKPKFI